MAESLLFNIADQILGTLAFHATEELCLAWDVKNELTKVKCTISIVQAVLLDAEEKQKQNRAVAEWLKQLKNVFYEAKDVLDEFEYQALQLKLVNQENFMKKVHHFVSCSSNNPLVFSFRMGHKIKKLREKIDGIAAEKAKFNLQEREEDRRIVHRNMESYSFLDSSSVVGRDHDKEKLVNRLLLMEPNDQQDVVVLPIVGIGGLGKTTLAKMVYNDPQIINKFDLRMWVWVSVDFDLKNVLAKIIKSGEIVADCDYSDMNQLQSGIRKTLNGKKFLLVLDDVWNNNRDKWLELRGFLMGGALGSQIIVTTRSSKVSSIMGTTSSYDLEDLSFEDSMTLFKKWAFKEGDESRFPKLLEIAREIVEKCKGVPLAIKSLGGLLYGKTDHHYWEIVRGNEIWQLESEDDGILPALKLSYDQLPSHLRQCFVHCSTYPKDWVFDSWDLIARWIAHGFITKSNANEKLEDIGRRYVDELVSRSFFHEAVDMGIVVQFKIHDLVHDLASFVAKDEYLTVKLHSQSIISSNFRHVSFSPDCDLSVEEVPCSLLRLDDNVQSIVVFSYEQEERTITKSFLETCISRFKCLRVLDLSDCLFEQLPSSIGNLKHLRFLDLSGNKIIKTLPSSFHKLLTLQYLSLSGCVELQKLPKKLGHLMSLRSLWLTTKERDLSGKVIGKLSSLRTLVIGECKNLEYLFDDHGIGLQNLTGLRSLYVSNCNNLVSLPRGLRHLTALEVLYIRNCEKLDLSTHDCQEGDIKDKSQSLGLKSLQCLRLRGLPTLDVLPHWLLQDAGATLKHLIIRHCINFTTLPENLASLEKLWIFECPQLTSLPECSKTLIEVEVDRCPALITRLQRETGEDWHKISHASHIYVDGLKI